MGKKQKVHLKQARKTKKVKQFTQEYVFLDKFASSKETLRSSTKGFTKFQAKKYIRHLLDNFGSGDFSFDDSHLFYGLYSLIFFVAGDHYCCEDLFEKFLSSKISKNRFEKVYRQYHKNKNDMQVIKNLEEMFLEMNKKGGCFNRKYLIGFLDKDVEVGYLSTLCKVDSSYIYKLRKKKNEGILKFDDFLRRYEKFLKRNRIKQSEYDVFEKFLKDETFNRSGKPLERIQTNNNGELYADYRNYFSWFNEIESSTDSAFVPYEIRTYKIFARMRIRFRVKKMKTWDVHFQCPSCFLKKSLERKITRLKRKIKLEELKYSKDKLFSRAVRIEKLKKEIEEKEKAVQEIIDNHVVVDINQREYVKDLEKNLKVGEIIVFQDFLNVNWSAYDLLLVSMHRDAPNEELKSNYYHYWANRNKDKPGLRENKNDSNYTIKSWEEFKSHLGGVTKVYIVSDGAGKHFKCGKALFYFSTLRCELDIPFEYIFLAPHHGANYCDTCFGRIKKEILKFQRENGGDIHDVQKIVEIMRNASWDQKSQFIVVWEEIGLSDIEVSKSKVFPNGIQKFFSINFCKQKGNIKCSKLSGKPSTCIEQKINASDGLYTPESDDLMDESEDGDNDEGEEMEDYIITEELSDEEELTEEQMEKIFAEECYRCFCNVKEFIDLEKFYTCSSGNCCNVVHHRCTSYNPKYDGEIFFCKWCKRSQSRPVK